MNQHFTDGFSTSPVEPVQREMMFRRLQRSQVENVLVKTKAQRLVALKSLRRSVVLRRQLHHTRLVGKLPSDEIMTSNVPSSLEPSVKALIDKLAEIAELIPSHSFEKRSADRTSRMPLNTPEGHDTTGLRRTELYPSNDIVESVTGLSSSICRVQPVVVSQDLQSGWKVALNDEDSHLDGAATHKQDELRAPSDEGKFAGESAGEMAPVDTSSRLHGYLISPEESMSQQLLDLDSDVNSLMKDLEDTHAQASGKEFDPKGARERTEVEAEKKRSEKARKRERAALLAHLEARTGGGTFRRPKWRWAAEGVPNPNPDRILSGKRWWRAAVFLVIVFYVRPRRNLMMRRARSKDRDTQDWNATLAIYFNRCQTWLLKAARVPVGNSILKNAKLNFRLNRLEGKREAYGASGRLGKPAGGGFISAFARKVARGVGQENVSLTLMRLKVHAKGVIHGLIQEMPPSDIMAFFSYLTGDGNYFPTGFFFEEETKMLSFDDLGAVRNLISDAAPPEDLKDTLYALHPSGDLQRELSADAQAHHEGFFEAHHLGWLMAGGHSLGRDGKTDKSDGSGVAGQVADLRAAVLHGSKTLPGKLRPLYRHEANGRWLDTSLVEMVLTNYVMIRVLLPWILLYPQESGLIPSSGVKPSALTHNCQVLASIVYLILRVLRPELTPPNPATMAAAVASETERAASLLLLTEEPDADDRKRMLSEGEGGDPDDKSIDERNGALDRPSDDSGRKDGGDKNEAAFKRTRTVPSQAPAKLRTVREIMQQNRYVSVSDKQLVAGLLPDAYFFPLAEQMRPWVLELAAEFDAWMQKVVIVVMGKAEGSVNHRDREENTSTLDT